MSTRQRHLIFSRDVVDIIATIMILFIPANLCAGQWETFTLRPDGTIPVWTVTGPFLNRYFDVQNELCFGYYKDFLGAVGGEQNAMPVDGDKISLDDGSSIEWHSVFINSSGYMNYLDVFSVDRSVPGVAYTYCQVTSKKKQQAVLKFRFDIRKQCITAPESYYVAFPFNMADSKIVYEVQGGLVTPGKTQLPGSASDWQTVQSFAAVRNSNGQIIFSSNQAPLVQFGDINLGKWQYVAKVEKPHIFSWIMNNYWFTNFPAFQDGEFTWSYSITSTSDTSNTKATHFGWGACQPLIGRAFLPGSRNGKLSLSTIQMKAPNVVLVQAKPSFDKNGVILQLREVEGKSGLISFTDSMLSKRVKSVHEVNALEKILTPNITEISMNPFEVRFIKLFFD